MAAPVIAAVSSGVIGDTSNEPTLTYATDGPAGLVSGQSGLVAVVCARASTSAPDITAETAGWTRVAQEAVTTGQVAAVAVFTKVYGGEATARFLVSTSNFDHGMTIKILRIEDFDDLAHQVATTPATSTHPFVINGVTTTIDDCLVIATVVSANNDNQINAFTFDAGTEQWDFLSNAGSLDVRSAGTAFEKAVAGATGTVTATTTLGSGITTFRGVMLAIAPEDEPPVPPTPGPGRVSVSTPDPCPPHSAAILDRDGATVSPVEGMVEYEWGRVLSDTASGRVFVVPQGDCCERLGHVRAWRHRLVLWRGSRLVFDGPIQTAEWSVDGVEIAAKDASGWLDKRLPHSDMDFASTDLVTIAQNVLADAFLPDDPGVSIEVVAPSLVFGDRSYRIDVDRSLDHLRDLSNTGMDWTVVANRILLFGADLDHIIGSLSDADFPQGLRVIEDGASLVSRWVLWSTTPGDVTLKSSSGGLHDYYGLLEGVHDSGAVEDQGAGSVLDQSSADAATASLLQSSLPAPVFIDTGAGPLSPTASIDVADIIPGYCLQVASTATCRPVTAVQKIYELHVSETTDGEVAQVVCAPATEAA